MKKVDIMICTKDRPTEVGLLLQSQRTQTFQNVDVYIYAVMFSVTVRAEFSMVRSTGRITAEDSSPSVGRRYPCVYTNSNSTDSNPSPIKRNLFSMTA